MVRRSRPTLARRRNLDTDIRMSLGPREASYASHSTSLGRGMGSIGFGLSVAAAPIFPRLGQ